MRLPRRHRFRRDHPREYGENHDVAPDLAAVAGPSPRIRGESRLCVKGFRLGGTIPANTGRMVSVVEGFDACWDHPREYGENHPQTALKTGRPGPSPRIRGEFAGGPFQGQYGGTIPANTGRIQGSSRNHQRWWDHPREYGENVSKLTAKQRALGPSPRIRGESNPIWVYSMNTGTIPANTGRICFRSRGPAKPAGPSPRIRGESRPGTEPRRH